MVKLTDRQVKNLKPKDKRYEVWEGNGFGIRVTPSGIKTWVYMYRYEDRVRRLTLGRYPKMTVAEAHSAYGNALAQLEKDEDPGKRAVDERRNERHAPTVGALAEEFLERWSKPHKRSWREDERMLNKDVLPTWRNRKAKDINRRDVISLLDAIVSREAPVTANRTLEIIRKMFNFGIERGILEHNPCNLVRAPGKVTRRERILTAEEIKEFWIITGQDRIIDDEPDCELPGSWPGRAVRLALQLSLVTAQRRNEIAGAKISEFDLSSGWWTIPADRSKNGLSHRVPLSDMAIDIVSNLIELANAKVSDEEGSRYLIPSPRGHMPINPAALTRAVSVIRNNLEFEHWTLHDLRRTAASQMTSIGISRLVVSKILNHVESGITAVYDRHSYDKEKRSALTAWSSRLDNIISSGTSDNIVSFAKASVA